MEGSIVHYVALYRQITRTKYVPIKVIVWFHTLLTASKQGGYFVGDPASVTPDDFESFVDVFLPTANVTTLATLRKLYPPVPDTDKLGNWQRVVDFISDVMFTCNAQFLASTSTMFSSEEHAAYRYVFGVGSAVHGSDVPFTFYTGNNNSNTTASKEARQKNQDDNSGIVSPDQAVQVAFDMQTMIMNFVHSGRPQIESFGYMDLPPYQEGDRAALVFNASRLYTIYSDPWKNARCDWWQQGWFAN
jgi:carboxylesterase type B